MTESEPYPRSLGHIGITVDDIDAGVEWYEDVLGFTHVMGPEKVHANEGHFGKLVADGMSGFEWMKIAHMATGNHVGVELFEYDTTDGESDPDVMQPGLNHICVQDPNIEALATKIDETGGNQIKDIWNVYPDEEYKMTYCEDPFGNYIEIHTHGYEHGHANMTY
ncbi:VOC family protein [Natrarchaeobius chitinivorans]|uniref:Glyoxalase n=1 Tax=Natrarchaeobius chitinivorans TaxID=1679083 RepID=A0A3N6N5K8_NATCH|nr:VOC family protein [Natrarchaeobius chitinivorans]RQG93572.1 glyoxalase [Natrarchaeobius chitinivorans]